MFEVLDEFFVVEVKLSLEEVLVILLHDILDLIEVFLGELIAVFEDGLDFVVDGVERVEVLLLEVALLRLVGQQRDLVGDLFVVLY